MPGVSLTLTLFYLGPIIFLCYNKQLRSRYQWYLKIQTKVRSLFNFLESTSIDIIQLSGYSLNQCPQEL